jgi:hypothetical protein
MHAESECFFSFFSWVADDSMRARSFLVYSSPFSRPSDPNDADMISAVLQALHALNVHVVLGERVDLSSLSCLAPSSSDAEARADDTTTAGQRSVRTTTGRQIDADLVVRLLVCFPFRSAVEAACTPLPKPPSPAPSGTLAARTLPARTPSRSSCARPRSSFCPHILPRPFPTPPILVTRPARTPARTPSP